MNYLFVGKNLYHGLTIIVFTTFFATSSFGAVLNPFPTRDRPPQYQQPAPISRQAQPSQELKQFRQEISRFQCPDLQALQVQLRNQFQSATTRADKEYYRGFLKELSREKDRKRCNN